MANYVRYFFSIQQSAKRTTHLLMNARQPNKATVVNNAVKNCQHHPLIGTKTEHPLHLDLFL